MDEIKSADFILLPFKYEIIYDFSEEELIKEGLTMSDIPYLKEIAVELEHLSFRTGKKLIVFFYRDSFLRLPFRNALIFRTSTFASYNRDGEFGMPAFIDNFRKTPQFRTKSWQSIPSVSFRGSSAPLKLPTGIQVRTKLNEFFDRSGISFRVKNWYNEGYLLRRKAILSVQRKAAHFKTDFYLNQVDQGTPQSVLNYWKSLETNDYFICTRGHGNYSFRLYEIMQHGRIPVFIQTDSLLPAMDVIPWKNITIWIEEKEVNSTAEKILNFHHSIKPGNFIELQQEIRVYWQKYLCYKGFATYLIDQFLPDLMFNGATHDRY